MIRRVILWYLLVGTVMAASSHLTFSQEKTSATRASTIPDNSVVISVPKDGEFYFGLDRISEAEIPDRLKRAFKDKPLESQVVCIRAGSNVSYKTVVSVIDTIRGAGFQQIGLVTSDDAGSKQQVKSPTRGTGKSTKVRGRRHRHSG